MESFRCGFRLSYFDGSFVGGYSTGREYSTDPRASPWGQLVHHSTTNSPLDGEHRPHLGPGDVLKREWRGTIHRVTVDSHGYVYYGMLFGSLSEVARKITGTRRSGPRFFGLERKQRESRPEGSRNV